jgi:uncharacterized protein (DUF1778 family)
MAARLDMRIDPGLKAEAERAAALSGSRSLTEFVLQAIREKSATVIREHERITLEAEDFEAFFRACSEPVTPGPRLREAAKRHDDGGFA